MSSLVRSTWFAGFLIFGAGVAGLQAQGPEPGVPHATLQLVSTMQMPAEPDSNSPVVWRNLGAGGNLFTIFSSTWQGPSATRGSTMMPAGPPTLVDFTNRPPYNHWFEAMIPAADQTWYGFYHYEVPASTVCPNDPRHMPALGAARSFDFGQTWEDLGVILRAPLGTHLCSSINTYFVGGVGDFSAVLDPTDNNLYIFFSQYSNVVADQGVAVARMPWADRNAPVGKVTVYRDGRWVPAFVPEGTLVPGVTPTWQYVSGTPIFPAQRSWHSTDGIVDAFWGPSVHWNTYLNRFVMLLNRSSSTTWTQEGIYISYAKGSILDWTTPKRLIAGGTWYPQVIGTEVGTGTDRLAGQSARLFVRGTSQYLIQFTSTGSDPVKAAPIEPAAPVEAAAPEVLTSLPEAFVAPSAVSVGFSSGGTTAGAGMLAAPVTAAPVSAPPTVPATADVHPVHAAVEAAVTVPAAAMAVPAVPDVAPASALPAHTAAAPRPAAPRPAAGPAVAPALAVTVPFVPSTANYPAIYTGMAQAPGVSRERQTTSDAFAGTGASTGAATSGGAATLVEASTSAGAVTPVEACGEPVAATSGTEVSRPAEPAAEATPVTGTLACQPPQHGAAATDVAPAAVPQP